MYVVIQYAVTVLYFNVLIYVLDVYLVSGYKNNLYCKTDNSAV
jgi:hypothetical protein